MSESKPLTAEALAAQTFICADCGERHPIATGHPQDGYLNEPQHGHLCGAVMATCRNEPDHPGHHWNPDIVQPDLSGLDEERLRAAYCRVMHPGQHDEGPYCVARHGDAIAAEYARLTTATVPAEPESVVAKDVFDATYDHMLALARATPASDELRAGRDWEEYRKDRGWPTPNHMRRTADALDTLTPAKYGDVLRWVADACDTALKAVPSHATEERTV